MLNMPSVNPRKLQVSLIVLLCSVFQFSFAQTIFHSGYIIKDGTKISGLISFKAKKEKGEYILFKTTKNESPQEIKADQISEFFLNEFNARFFPVQDKNTGKIIFTELIREGTVNLYTRDNLYILMKDTSKLQITLPLNKITYRDEKEAYSKKRQEVLTRGAVTNFLKDCKDLKIESINISILKKSVDKYNICTNKSTPPPKKKGGFGFSLVGGLNLSATKFKGGDGYFYEKMDFDPSFGYLAGAGITFGSKKYLSFISGNVQMLYNTQEYKGKGTIRDAGALYTEHHEATINISTLRFPISLRRYFSPGHEGVFAEAGGIYIRTLNLESTDDYYGEYDNGNAGPSGTLNDFLTENKLSLTFFGGLGYSRRIGKLKYAGTLKLEYGNGSAYYRSSTQKVMNTSLNLSLGF